MAQIFKWLSRLFGAMAVLAALAAALVWVLLGGSLPDYDRDFTVEGVEGPVTLLRDIHAVPHIRGASEADVFFGLGFAHAQDRLWQMETSRRAAEGRLSELFGEVTLPVDRFMRALDLHGLARRALPAQTPEARAALDLWSPDALLRAAAARDAPHDLAALEGFAAAIGSAGAMEDAEAARRGKPELLLFDRGGRRLDEVRFHPGYHAMMTRGAEAGYAARPWEPGGAPGGQAAHALMVYMLSQVEPGVCCPLTMTYAAVPALEAAALPLLGAPPIPIPPSPPMALTALCRRSSASSPASRARAGATCRR